MSRRASRFLTALELKDDNPLPAVNLVTLSLLQDNWNQAEDLVKRLRLKPEQFAEAQARAQQLRAGGRGPLAARTTPTAAIN
jgi:Flp pilus assembly protein TadD